MTAPDLPMQSSRPIPIPLGDADHTESKSGAKLPVKRSISISSIKHISRISDSPPNPSHPLQGYDSTVNQYCSFDCTAFEDSDCDDTFDDEDDDGSKSSLSIESSSSLASSAQSNQWFGSPSMRPSRRTPPTFPRQLRLSISSSTSPPSFAALSIKSASSNCTTHTFATSTLARSSSLESVSSLKQASRRPSRTLASNLTESLKSIQNSVRKRTASITATFTLTPRMTDDVLPHQPAVVEEELTTFRGDGADITSRNPTITPRFKNRDQRVNPDFLRLYAFDYSGRTSGMLPIAHTSSELERLLQGSEAIRQFHHANNLHKISNASKEKLWRGVILGPRSDRCPYSHIECDSYVNTDITSTQSLVRLHGTHQPWNVNGARCFKPAGILYGAKECINGHAPSSGVTRSQYTVKGWCNSRWLATEI
ncbi:hypothetical protein PGUG_02211 [Meyerozyma guilliermondii ATCC 6260]|uniref:Uncharacterized protein n=1 Tax=Meyerozyma guilliermondii (strain ATCC 6260 / CBS 566 / DSM 6381 / JCM 1539 / NBRC 10279 / NRRL Y-324) TaxID=294746 RepID=A5DG10_PICGU|nr:uncharacterized protein PGUG_02211 [Meyerozyma guilliermondii ATCC 6260]EDK38113.2 hypothetical protein PGUG_02211 [Meyerozyma guilliermondii ATCC 6260]